MHNELTTAELEHLENFLYSEAVPEDCLDLVGVHGLFTACNISPKTVNKDTCLELVFAGEVNWASSTEQNEIEQLLERFYQQINKSLYSEQDIELPCELTLLSEDDDISALTWWSQAFMEGLFVHEEDWFNHQEEEQAAELVLPIMVASELFEDDPEIAATRENEGMMEEMVQQIPELLIDLYLLFHAPQK